MSHVAGMDVSLSISILCEKQMSGIVNHISEYPFQNLETQSWNIINDGGVRCKAKVTNKVEVETGEVSERKITEPFEDIQEPSPQFETVYEECIPLDHIELFEDVDHINMGCTFATEADRIEILAVEILDRMNEKEQMPPMMKRLLSKEFEVNEKMEHHRVEEEEEITPCEEQTPPLISWITSS